ncbi:FadR/GntR family transcriptional regulator [Mesorhizobium sp. A556]
MVEVLSADINSGAIQPQECLPSEAELADSFEVSRSVIREAISRMKADGLVISKQGLGVFVTAADDIARPFRIEDTQNPEIVREIFELRVGVEAEAAALAALRRTKTDLRTFKDVFKSLVAGTSDLELGVAADLEFHLAISKMSKNSQITRFTSYLEKVLRENISVARHNSAKTAGYAELVLNEHRVIYDAICGGDAEAARRGLRAHLESAQKRLGIR